MAWNNWGIITGTRRYIFRWCSRCPCGSSSWHLLKVPIIGLIFRRVRKRFTLCPEISTQHKPWFDQLGPDITFCRFIIVTIEIVSSLRLLENKDSSWATQSLFSETEKCTSAAERFKQKRNMINWSRAIHFALRFSLCERDTPEKIFNELEVWILPSVQISHRTIPNDHLTQIKWKIQYVK